MLSKICQKVVIKNSKNCQKVVKKSSKSCQKVIKKLSKSCQRNVKVVKKLAKFKTSGEDDDDDDEEEEEDWWLLDQVATSSHLVKTDRACVLSHALFEFETSEPHDIYTTSPSL
jgi:hypothetical protein